MKKTFALVLALAMVFSLFAINASAAKSDEFHLELKFSNVFNPKEWNYKASQMLADMITERTEGHVVVTYYGTNELDCYADSVTQAVNGSLWMGLEEPSLFADYCGDAAMVIAPMLYSSNEEYNYVMDSEIVANVIETLKESNIHILDTHYSFGFRSVCSNLDVTTPADLNGHQFRATSSALFAKTLECLGATPVVMGFTDCLAAIQQGVVEGFEGSVSTLSGAGEPYELVKKVASTNHLIATRWLFMPEDVWQSIPEEYQTIIEECAYECGMWEQKSCEEDEAVQIEMLKGEGVTWNDVDLDAFGAAMNPVIDWIVEEYGSTYEAYEAIKGLVAEYRAANS